MQVTNFTIVGSTANTASISENLHGFVSLPDGNSDMPGGLHARFCHKFLVLFCYLCRFLTNIANHLFENNSSYNKPIVDERTNGVPYSSSSNPQCDRRVGSL